MVVDDEQRLVGEPRLDRAQAADLRVVVVRPVEVVDADAPVAELAALEHLERVALEDRRALGAEAAQVLLQPSRLAAGQLRPFTSSGPNEKRSIATKSPSLPRIAPIRLAP